MVSGFLVGGLMLAFVGYIGLVLIYTVTTLPFVIWMMLTFIDEVPYTLEHTIASEYGTGGIVNLEVDILARYLEPLLAEIPDNEDPARFELPEVNRLLQRLTKTVGLGLFTGVGLPLIGREKVIGVIFVFRNYSGIFTSNDRSLLQSFANQAAIAVDNAQLYQQVSQEKQRMDALLDSAADGILIISPTATLATSY